MQLQTATFYFLAASLRCFPFFLRNDTLPSWGQFTEMNSQRFSSSFHSIATTTCNDSSENLLTIVRWWGGKSLISEIDIDWIMFPFAGLIKASSFLPRPFPSPQWKQNRYIEINKIRFVNWNLKLYFRHRRRWRMFDIRRCGKKLLQFDADLKLVIVKEFLNASTAQAREDARMAKWRRSLKYHETEIWLSSYTKINSDPVCMEPSESRITTRNMRYFRDANKEIWRIAIIVAQIFYIRDVFTQISSISNINLIIVNKVEFKVNLI